MSQRICQFCGEGVGDGFMSLLEWSGGTLSPTCNPALGWGCPAGVVRPVKCAKQQFTAVYKKPRCVSLLNARAQAEPPDEAAFSGDPVTNLDEFVDCSVDGCFLDSVLQLAMASVQSLLMGLSACLPCGLHGVVGSCNACADLPQERLGAFSLFAQQPPGGTGQLCPLALAALCWEHTTESSARIQQAWKVGTDSLKDSGSCDS